MSPGRVLTLLAILVALAVAGCGSSADESSENGTTATATTPAAPPGASVRSCEGAVAGIDDVRVTGAGCEVGHGVVAGWVGRPSCSRPAGESRFSCSVYGGYRCLSASVASGVAVSCSRPGSSVAFVARRG
jgi:hypothetical protein